MDHKNRNPVKSLYSERISLSVYLILFTGAWIYIWLRGYFIPFQSDEAATFFMYVQPGQFFPPYSTIDANNHILNSVLTWISFQAFGSSPLALRLPNILAAPVYFFFILRLSGLFNWKIAKWGFIMFSTGTHFLLEFYSYSRGYGLSIAFIAGALYELIIFSKEIRIKQLIMAILCTFLATAANLNLIFISLSVYLFLSLILLRTESLSKKTKSALFLTIIIIGGLSSIYFIYNSFQIREASGFYYGSSDGFFKVTVESLAIMISGRFKIIVEVLAVSAFIIAGLISLFTIAIKKKHLYFLNSHIIFLAMLMISWIASLLLNHIWKVNFQEDRTAMHLIPLFYGMIFFGLDNLTPSFRKYAFIAILPLAIILVYSFQQLSFKKTVYGNSQQVPADFFQYIKEEASGKQFPPVVSSYQARRQGWAFLNYRTGGMLNPLTGSAFPNQSADFLIHEYPLPDYLKNIFIPVLSDQNTQTALYRNIASPDLISSDTLTLENPINGRNEYYELFNFPSDTLIGKAIRLETELTLESPAKPLQAAIVVEVFDINRKSLAYEAIDLDQLKPSWDRENQSFRHVILIHNIPNGSARILLYFWNKKKAPMHILEGSTTIKIANRI